MRAVAATGSPPSPCSRSAPPASPARPLSRSCARSCCSKRRSSTCMQAGRTTPWPGSVRCSPPRTTRGPVPSGYRSPTSWTSPLLLLLAKVMDGKHDMLCQRRVQPDEPGVRPVRPLQGRHRDVRVQPLVLPAGGGDQVGGPGPRQGGGGDRSACSSWAATPCFVICSASYSRPSSGC